MRQHSLILSQIVLLALCARGEAGSEDEVVVTTLAGLAGSAQQVDGTGVAARFNLPRSLAIGADGNLYVTDGVDGGSHLRRVTPSGVVTTILVAEGLRAVAADSKGSIYAIVGIAVLKVEGENSTSTFVEEVNSTFLVTDHDDNLYVRAKVEKGPGPILKISPTGELIEELELRIGAQSLVIDLTGMIFLTDRHAVFRVAVGTESVVLLAGKPGTRGSDDGTGGLARFSSPGAITVDPEGNLFVADADNDTVRKLKHVPFGNTTLPEEVITIAGSARERGHSDGEGMEARFFVPRGIVSDNEGNIYVADTNNHTIRKLTPTRNKTEVLYLAQFGNGEGFTADIVATNPSRTRTVEGTAELYDDDGNPLSVGLASSDNSGSSFLKLKPTGRISGFDFILTPLAALTVSTDGLGELVRGSALIRSNGVLGAAIRFSIPGIGIAGVGASSALTAFQAPVRREEGIINTGMAIQNTETNPVTVRLSLLDEQGAMVPNGSVVANLAPRGHQASFIDELFPEADTQDFVGTVIVEVEGGHVAATALELGPSPGQFTTLPVTALD